MHERTGVLNVCQHQLNITRCGKNAQDAGVSLEAKKKPS